MLMEGMRLEVETRKNLHLNDFFFAINLSVRVRIYERIVSLGSEKANLSLGHLGTARREQDDDVLPRPASCNN